MSDRSLRSKPVNTLFYPWYFENRPLGNYLRQCNFLEKPTCANVVEIAKWQVAGGRWQALLLCEKCLDSHYNAFSKRDGT